jgi:hypothetical protein
MFIYQPLYNLKEISIIALRCIQSNGSTRNIVVKNSASYNTVCPAYVELVMTACSRITISS